MGDEAVKDIQKRVALEDLFPNVVCIIPVFVVGVARTTGHTGTVGAHVERHEVGGVVFELGCHPCLIQVNGKVDQETVIKPEGKLLGAAILLKLLHGAPNVLTLELVFQLNGHNGDTVHREHHVYGVCAAGGILELTGAAKNIGLIQFNKRFVQGRLRLKVANLQFDAHICDAVAEHIDQALIGDCLLQAGVELVRSFVTVVFDILRPLFRLRVCDKLTEHVHIDTACDIVLPVMYPIPVSILSNKLLVAALL